MRARTRIHVETQLNCMNIVFFYTLVGWYYPSILLPGGRQKCNIFLLPPLL